MPNKKLTPKFVTEVTTRKNRERFQDIVQCGLVLRVTQKGRKDYYFIATIPIPGQGETQVERQFAKATEITLSEARARVKAFLSAYIAQTSDPLFIYTKPKTLRSKLPTLREVFEKWLLSNKKQEKTAKYKNMQNGYSVLSKNYKAIDKKGKETILVRGLAELKVDEITEKKIAVWQKDMLEVQGQKPSSVNRVCLELKHLLKFAQEEGMTDDSYQVPNIPKLSEKEIDPKTDYLKKDEVQKLLVGLDTYVKAANGKKYDRNYIRDIILFLLYTGLRPASVCGLQWKDIDFNEKHPRIILRASNIKTKSTESIVPSDAALAILKRLYAQNDVEPDAEANIFTTYSPDMICKKVKKVLRFVFGVDTPYSAYTLRHTFATHLSMYADLSVVQRAMTHKRINTTMKYISVDAERVREAVNRLPFQEEQTAKSSV